MIRYSDIRKLNYKDRRQRNFNFDYDIYDWKSNPYTCLKSRVYIELSSIFAFLSQFTPITANQISLIYCFSGFMAGIFLISNIDILMIGGLLIFFLKSSLDWTDGLVARIKKETSSVGHLLDAWGSHIGGISLITSLGIYCYNNTNDIIFLFLVFMYLFIQTIDFKFYSYHQAFYEIVNKKMSVKTKITNNQKIKENILVIFLKNFMDNRSRTVDLVCLLIFLEILFSFERISIIVFILYFIKAILIFFGIIYVYYFKDGLKNQLND